MPVALPATVGIRLSFLKGGGAVMSQDLLKGVFVSYCSWLLTTEMR